MEQPTIRDASYGDFPRIAHVLAQAFWDDNLFGEVIHPHRERYPRDMELYWLRKARVTFWDYRWKFLVAVDKDESGREVVVGCAQWERLGEGGKKMECWWLDPRNLLKPVSSIAMKVHKLIWPDRAADPDQEDILDRAHPYFEHLYEGDRAECWSLSWLGVHPDYQGKGFSRELVRWGLDQAKAENVWAAVIAAKGKDPFYKHCGFEFILGSGGMGKGNPLADIEGANMHWKAPEGTNHTFTRTH